MLQQWEWRRGLEAIKAKHSMVHNPLDQNLKANQKAEIQGYLGWVREQQDKELLKDVYVTDNKPKAAKYNVNNEKELDAYIKYQQDKESYNADIDVKPKASKKKGKYRQGSLAQRIFEPLINAEQDENGTYHVKVEAVDITKVDEETLRKLYENAKDKTNSVHEGEPDDEEFRIQLMQDLESDNVSLERWNEILAEELGVFKRDEEYDFVTDLRRNFSDSLAESRQSKIFKTIPDHVFWDIKKPLHRHLEKEFRVNEINPSREHYTRDFFDLRANEEWRNNRKTKRDFHQDISMFRRY